jgi:UDP-sugar transporter A1/2/3
MFFTWALLIFFASVQVICAIILLIAEGGLKKQFSNWSLTGSLTASGLPAAIYALQNSLLQISYKNLDSLTFSILNQTKLLWTAFFTYLILGYVWLTPHIYIVVFFKHSSIFQNIQNEDLMKK